MAIALASFLELALVSSALLARAAALAGRPGGVDAAAVWVVSATSGLLAGVHELVVTTPDGSSTWSTDPGSVLAAAVRAVAPLVAAWLWERVLQAARAEQAERMLAEGRRDRRLLEAARAALAVRRLDALNPGRTSSRRLRRARRRLDKAHVGALRVTHVGPTLPDVLAAVGQVDHLPAATIVTDPATGSDNSRTQLTLIRPRTALAAADRTSTVSALVRQRDTTPQADTEAGRDSSLRDIAPDPLTVALDLVRADRTVSGSRVADELSRRGRPVSVRTGQRLRNRAVEILEHGPTS